MHGIQKFCMGFQVRKIFPINNNKFGDQLRRSESSILTLMIIFQVKINVALYIESRNGVKIFKKSQDCDVAAIAI